MELELKEFDPLPRLWRITRVWRNSIFTTTRLVIKVLSTFQTCFPTSLISPYLALSPMESMTKKVDLIFLRLAALMRQLLKSYTLPITWLVSEALWKSAKLLKSPAHYEKFTCKTTSLATLELSSFPLESASTAPSKSYNSARTISATTELEGLLNRLDTMKQSLTLTWAQTASRWTQCKSWSTWWKTLQACESWTWGITIIQVKKWQRLTQSWAWSWPSPPST